MKPLRLAIVTLLAVGLLAGVMSDRVGAISFLESDTQSGNNYLLSSYWSPKIQQWDTLIVQEAKRRGLDPDFLASLVWMESRGDAEAVGPMGAVGLMQVMPKEAGFSWRPTREELLNPFTNLYWGTRTLATVVRQGHGDIFNALAAYNGGWEQVMYRGPRYFAATILRDYANAVVLRYNLQDRWIAFFAVKGASIHGPIWVADSSRKDVYLFGQDNLLPDGVPLIPDVPPGSVVAHCVEEESGAVYDVGVWLYNVDHDVWSVAGAPLETAVEATPLPLDLPAPSSPTPTLTPTPFPTLVDTPAPSLPTPTPSSSTPTLTPTPNVTPTPSPTPMDTTKSNPVTMVDAVVLQKGAELRPGATRWWNPTQMLEAGTALNLIGYDPAFPEWVYVATLDNTGAGWTQVANLEIHRDLRRLPKVTPVPTLTPSPTPTSTPTPTPTIACDGNPLSAEAWYFDRANTPDGWQVTIYAAGRGGDCVYTYAWNEEVVSGPTTGPLTFVIHLSDRNARIIGTVSVMSGNETVKIGVYVDSPDNDPNPD